jgi:hypothetical protein
MEPFEIFITSISWGSGGKNRPVLALMLSGESILVYPITTQYENKSAAIRARYFKIYDWSLAGLDRQSYIDIGTLLKLPLSVIDCKKSIGKLTIADKKRLLNFLKNSIEYN